MMKLLNRFKEIFMSVVEGIGAYKKYKRDKL